MKPLRVAVPLLLVLAAAAPGSATAHASAPVATAAQAAADDDEVVLPGRLAGALRRTQRSLDNAEDHVDEGEYRQAVSSLRAVRRNMYRADKSARHQMTAVPADPEAETTPGPDSVVAVLAMDGTVVQSVSGLFDSNSKGLVDGLTHALYRTMNARDRLLDAVIALDPEGDGAAYADGMADTVDGYADEVATLTEALSDDQLSTGGRRVLKQALKQSQATQAKVAATWGGGE
jgi:hypothetical protein